MQVIDCDAHVEESVETWSYLDPEFYLLRPIPVVFPEDTCFDTHNAAWVIDYKLRLFAAQSDPDETGTGQRHADNSQKTNIWRKYQQIF